MTKTQEAIRVGIPVEPMNPEAPQITPLHLARLREAMDRADEFLRTAERLGSFLLDEVLEERAYLKAMNGKGEDEGVPLADAELLMLQVRQARAELADGMAQVEPA